LDQQGSDLLARLDPKIAANDWHAAAAAWEVAMAERRLAEQLDQLASRGSSSGSGGSSGGAAKRGTNSAAAAAAGRLKLECVRRSDEARGTHRRAKAREVAAACVVAPLVEAARSWSGRSSAEDQDGSGRAATSSFAVGTSLRDSSSSSGSHGGSATGRRRTFSAAGGASSDGNSDGSPLRLLFGGVAAGEPRCDGDERQLQAAFAAASHSRAEQADLLANYLQVGRLFLNYKKGYPFSSCQRASFFIFSGPARARTPLLVRLFVCIHAHTPF
jgi:hypothetical protein